MDDVILQGQGIFITRTMARFGDASYPIANIGAVTIEDDPSPFLGMAAFFGLLAFVVWAVGSGKWGFWLLVLTVIFGYLASRSSGRKLMLRTSSGNEQAFSSTDKVLVERVKSAIEQAIVQRG